MDGALRGRWSVMLTARWRGVADDSLEHCALSVTDQGAVIEAVVVAGSFAIRYRITCDFAWRTRAVDVDLIGGASPVRLTADGAGSWWRDGEPLAHLAGAIDVDITATPMTNTLPIRRLPLRDGASADITAAYITSPEMTVTTSRQRYTRLGPSRYRFESLDSDFAQELTVDDHGLVVHYPTLFERTC